MTGTEAFGRWAAILALAAVGGCAGGSPTATPLHTQDFVLPSAAAARPAPAPAVALDPPSEPPTDKAPVEAAAPADPAMRDAGILDVVRDAVRPEASPASQPAPAAGVAPGASSGEFLVCGGVVAVVNDTPIYADRVITLIEKPLQQKAKTLDPAAFRDFAMGLIDNQVRELVNNELEFAAASHTISDEDKKIADAITQEWRKQQIREAGGSVEMARQKAQAGGVDFDDAVKEQYRANVARIYYQRNIVPHIQVTADDMRRYYQHNAATEFTVHDAARFRLIKIDVAATGGPQKALDKAREKLARAQRGDDFAVMAARENDDKHLAINAGLVSADFIERGAFVIDKVDEEVWKLEPGQVGDLIQTPDAFYIVKVEALRRGRVMSFEEEAVQDHIRDKLRSAQFRELREKEQNTLEKAAIVQSNTDMMNIALDIAMQGYVRWRAVP